MVAYRRYPNLVRFQVPEIEQSGSLTGRLSRHDENGRSQVRMAHRS
jgi:hypothetical protein